MKLTQSQLLFGTVHTINTDGSPYSRMRLEVIKRDFRKEPPKDMVLLQRGGLYGPATWLHILTGNSFFKAKELLGLTYPAQRPEVLDATLDLFGIKDVINYIDHASNHNETQEKQMGLDEAEKELTSEQFFEAQA